MLRLSKPWHGAVVSIVALDLPASATALHSGGLTA